MLWMAHSGAPWRMLPSEFDSRNSVYKCFAGWSDRCVWRRMRDAFVGDPDMEFILIDSTVARERQAAGAPLKAIPRIPALRLHFHGDLSNVNTP